MEQVFEFLQRDESSGRPRGGQGRDNEGNMHSPPPVGAPIASDPQGAAGGDGAAAVRVAVEEKVRMVGHIKYVYSPMHRYIGIYVYTIFVRNIRTCMYITTSNTSQMCMRVNRLE